MKIGYLVELDINIVEPPYDGPANHVRHVIHELARRGHSVRLLFRRDGQIWRSDDLAVFEPVSVQGTQTGSFRNLERVVRRTQSELGAPYIGLFESARFAVSLPAGACRV